MVPFAIVSGGMPPCGPLGRERSVKSPTCLRWIELGINKNITDLKMKPVFLNTVKAKPQYSICVDLRNQILCHTLKWMNFKYKHPALLYTFCGMLGEQNLVMYFCFWTKIHCLLHILCLDFNFSDDFLTKIEVTWNMKCTCTPTFIASLLTRASLDMGVT